MSGLPLFGGLLGGVGLFLLGMGLMTDGLRLAAGPALERGLARSTQTRWRGLASGALVTVLVQSSSAVTVATIGFVNAGLLTLGQALWVLFGANVGTTMTGWLVALVGMKFDIDLLALPLIGIGMLLRLGGEGARRGALGMALGGFGVLFLGIDLLKETFTGVAAQIELPSGQGVVGLLAMVLVGILMTVLMQASAAALVLAFSAAQSGLVSLEAAAAVVIGANIGTTVTALLAAIGATANAKRSAAAHILFNLLTGAVAFFILPWLLAGLGLAGRWLGMDDAAAAQLALFHTVFNLLGVVLIWPLADGLGRFLQQRFRTAEEDEARPRHLDQTVLAVPALALDALGREVRRLGELSRAAVQAALVGSEPRVVARHQAVIGRLNKAVADFVVQLNRAGMSPDSASRLAAVLRLARYCESAAEAAVESAQANAEVAPDGLPEPAALANFRTAGSVLLAACAVPDPASRLAGRLAAMESAYQAAKAALLEAGAGGRLPVAAMDARLRAASSQRRALEQAAKAVLRQNGEGGGDA